ncbi:MAG: transglutaminase domain-containing protein [Thermaerobacter sp.]|nr:transglutaminase domain-containing protein [Thermaerobacter sp.]
MSRARNLLLLRGIWLGLLVWPYAVASGVPRPLALAALPAVLALLFGDGLVRFAVRIAAALLLGSVASLQTLSIPGVHHLLTAQDPQVLTSFVTSVLLWFTALLGWQVFRDAISRTRLLWLWLMGAVVLGINHRFWGVAADIPTLAYIGIGLFLLGIPEDEQIRMPIALASLLPLAGAFVGLLAAPAVPTTLPAQNTRALNLAGLRVAVTPENLPSQVNINQPVSLPSTPLLAIAGVPRPSYWQEAIYNQFNGDAWLAPPGARTPLPLTAPLLPPSATGIPTSTWHVRVTQFVPGSIGPVIYAGTPLGLQSDGGPPYEVPAARALYLPGVSSYSLTLSVPTFTAQALETARYLPATDVPPADLMVPESLSHEIGPLARSLQAGTSTPWQLAAHIRDYLNSHEAYDPNFSPSRRDDPIGRFLLRTHLGYCDQFSTAFIMLARLDGLPARWVVGFAPGPYDAQSHSETLLAKDAHSWAEIDVAPYGWVPIDPTPSALAPPQPTPKPPAHPPAQGHPRGDSLATLLVLALAAIGFIVWRRPPSLRSRIQHLENGFSRLCPLERRIPPTLRERLLAQSPALRQSLMPVLLLLEQARYGRYPPTERDVAEAEQALRAIRRVDRPGRKKRPPA